MGCLLFAWWFGYSPFESEFVGDNIRVTECSALRVLAPIPQKLHLSEDDKVIYELVSWILEKDMTRRPFLEDVLFRVNAALSAVLKVNSSSRPREGSKSSSDRLVTLDSLV